MPSSPDSSCPTAPASSSLGVGVSAGLGVCAAVTPCCLALAWQLGLSELSRTVLTSPTSPVSWQQMVNGDMGWSACSASPPPEIQALKPRNTDPPTQYCTGLEVAIYQATVVTSANTYTALTVGHSPLHDCCNDPMRQTLRHPFCKRGILRPERRGSALNSSLI